MAKQEGRKLSAPQIALLIIIYPIGMIYLIYVLLSKNKDNLGKKANILRGIAVFLFFVVVLNFVAVATGNTELEDPGQIIYGLIVFVILCGGGGLALLMYANKLTQRAKLVDKYSPPVFQQGLEDLEQIAAVSGVSYDQALQDLQLLKSKGLLQDRYLDHQAGKLVWPGKPTVRETVDAVVCPHCGATNRIPSGGPHICEYCDSEL